MNQNLKDAIGLGVSGLSTREQDVMEVWTDEAREAAAAARAASAAAHSVSTKAYFNNKTSALGSDWKTEREHLDKSRAAATLSETANKHSGNAKTPDEHHYAAEAHSEAAAAHRDVAQNYSRGRAAMAAHENAAKLHEGMAERHGKEAG